MSANERSGCCGVGRHESPSPPPAHAPTTPDAMQPSASVALEDRQKRRESSPPNQPASRAISECPILTKFSVVPAQPPRSLPVVASQSLTVPRLEVASRFPSGLNATEWT